MQVFSFCGCPVVGLGTGKPANDKHFKEEKRIMKKTRKGFTLVELLIVVAIIGVLGAMMMMSSTDAVDSAGANAILSNLSSMKTAAMAMYMEDAEAASTSPIQLNDTAITGKLAKYLGKSSTATGFNLGDGSGKYGLVGGASSWYVVYQFATSDTAGIKAKLNAKANDVDLFGASDAPDGEADGGECGFSDYYDADATTIQTYIALKVR